MSGEHQGQDESGVGYAKRNAIAGHAFDSWAAFEAHLERWMCAIADLRMHGTAGEAPLMRFERDGGTAVTRLDGHSPFRQVRELVRRVRADCAMEIDGNIYSVSWRLIGESAQVRIHRGGEEVAARVSADNTKREPQREHVEWMRR